MTGNGVPIDDRGLNYGDGLFETIRVQSGRLPLLPRHLSRLESGCARIGLSWPGRDALTAQLMTAAAGITTGVVKLVLTRGSGGRGYAPSPASEVRSIISRHPLPAYPPDNYRRGVSVRVCATRLAQSPDTAGLKHLGRLEQVLASMEPDAGTVEGLMRDPAGHVVEGIRSNLFLVTDEVLITPDLGHSGVAGVMRAEVLETAARLKAATEIRQVSLADLRSADEAFLSSSVFGIWPICQVLELCELRSPGPMASRLMTAIAASGFGDWVS